MGREVASGTLSLPPKPAATVISKVDQLWSTVPLSWEVLRRSSLLPKPPGY